ncbi:hypothetical protein [Flammeovirga sp. SJP92]|uniref:hypothetical protein n=1 Tax=Flammeovirga sp. SJP92 TaxID=1775430 RepID=UPI000786A2C9|nr:hypothetical protein [Flammeovirga sp. SJP92]KXX69712.1 hypothetical protein AVL50_12520 [Flammeovirga sp. SJP92]
MKKVIFTLHKAQFKGNLSPHGEIEANEKLFPYAEKEFGIKVGSKGLLDKNNEEVTFIDEDKIIFNEFTLYSKIEDELTFDEKMAIQFSQRQKK